MTRPILAALLVATLSACATSSPTSYQQAAAPAFVPAPTPPVMTPGFAPGTPAAPVYTPNGAGLYDPTRGTQQPTVPRSPNKRVLPATKEAGLWAADGAPTASARELLFGVDIPDPAGSAVLVDASRACVDTVAHAARAVGADKDAMLFPPRVRSCMAAWAYFMCAKHRAVVPRPPLPRGVDVTEEEFERATAVGRLAMHAMKLSRDECRDVVRTKEQMDILDAVDAQWLLMMRGGGGEP